jgi:hypothetical protein
MAFTLVYEAANVPEQAPPLESGAYPKANCRITG